MCSVPSWTLCPREAFVEWCEKQLFVQPVNLEISKPSDRSGISSQRDWIRRFDSLQIPSDHEPGGWHEVDFAEQRLPSQISGIRDLRVQSPVACWGWILSSSCTKRRTSRHQAQMNIQLISFWALGHTQRPLNCRSWKSSNNYPSRIMRLANKLPSARTHS